MRSIAFADFLIGVGILFVLEGLMFAASPAWMRRAMKSAMATPDNILRMVGIGSAVVGLDPDLAGAALALSSVNTDPASPSEEVVPDQRNREPLAAGFSPKCPAQMLAPQTRSGALWTSNSTLWREADMTGARPALSRRLRLMGAAISIGAASVLGVRAGISRAARTASPTSPRR